MGPGGAGSFTIDDQPAACYQQGELLIDGGYLNNMPVDVMRGLGVDTVRLHHYLPAVAHAVRLAGRERVASGPITLPTPYHTPGIHALLVLAVLKHGVMLV